MKKQFEHSLLSSFLLFVDHEILTKGNAFANYGSVFYPSINKYQSRFTYAAPFKQLVNDSSVVGANLMTGVYLNNTFSPVGQNNLLAINHYNGTCDFSSNVSATISGNYAIKDVNVYMTTDPDETIVFEKKFFTNSKYPQTLSGLAPDTYIIPAVFIKKRGGENKPFALGGVDNTSTDIRAIIVSDNTYVLDAVAGILKDTNLKTMNFVDAPPFDARGAYTGTQYNYETYATGQKSTIWKVSESKVLPNSQIKNIGDNLYVSFIDFEVSTLRSHG
jgi:hypothetical protein